MTILGIDPGLATTGYAFLNKEGKNLSVLTYGCILTPKHWSLSERLSDINKQLSALLKKYKPSLAAVEEIFFFKNLKTAINVSHVRGVLLFALQEHHVPLIELTPLQVKQATTGYGKATKDQIQKMVKIILNLTEIPKPDDAADALAIAFCASQYNKQLE